MNRTATGLLLAEPFADLSGWINGGGWSLSSAPALLGFGAGGMALLGPSTFTGQGSETAGVREPQLFVEGGLWFLLYDSGDGRTGWRQFVSVSRDRGLTWTRAGALSPGLSNGATGTYPAVATGWLEKRGSTYYLHRVTAAGTFPAPDVGLPAGSYHWDTWSASSLMGQWTFVRATGPGGGFATSDELPGSVVKNGATFYAFVQGAGTVYQIGYAASSTPDGPWTLNTTAIWSTSFFGTRVPENPKVFFHPGISRWVALVNLIGVSGVVTDRNAAVVSASVTDWSASVPYLWVRASPSAGNANAVGAATHVTGPDGATVTDSGYVPVTFDGAATAYAPGWHQGRSCLASVLEPSPGGAVYSDAAVMNKNLTRPLVHGDFSAEFLIRLTSSLDTNIGLWYRQSSAAATADTYRLVVRATERLLLQKTVGGSTSTVANNNTAAMAAVNDGTWLRVRVEVAGSRHRAWLDGELQIDVTDASLAAGSHISLSGFAATGEVRLLSVRSGSAVTVNGLPPGTQVILRTWGDLPLAVALADSSGVALMPLLHGPAKSVEIEDVDYAPAGGVWPGDVFRASGQSGPRRAVGAARSLSLTSR